MPVLSAMNGAIISSGPIEREFRLSQADQAFHGINELGGVESDALTKVVDLEAAAFHDALEGANWNRLVSVGGDNDLTAIFMPPFLMTALLVDQREAISLQYPGNLFGGQNGKVRGHGRDISTSFAPLAGLISEGSNHSFSASLALLTASSSVSPAEAQPGISGNTADHRFVCGSNSTSNRSFIVYNRTGISLNCLS